MSSESPAVSPPSGFPGTLPRAGWVAGALLGLMGAAGAGALAIRIVEPVPAVAKPVAQVPSVDAMPVPKNNAPTTTSAPIKTASAPAERAAACANCGVVEAVNAVKEKGQGTGVGAVAGGVLGGVAGHQVGGGKGKTAMTVLGAIGGGLAGHEVEKRVRATTHYDVRVRMADGSKRVFQRQQAMAVGARVIVDGKSVRLARSTVPAAGTT